MMNVVKMHTNCAAMADSLDYATNNSIILHNAYYFNCQIERTFLYAIFILFY